MADVISMGLHQPSALPYLIAELILPDNPPQSAYTWSTYEGQGDVSEEELLSTSKCVVWSQDGHVRKVFKFDGDDQEVTQAVLTRFRRDTSREPNSSRTYLSPPGNHADNDSSGRDESLRVARWGTKAQHDSRYMLSRRSESSVTYDASDGAVRGYARALVIFLRNEAHVHYLSGPSHVVSLPFEVEKALPAVEGLVVQRKRHLPVVEPTSPVLPRVPPNSFFSSQGQLLSQQKSPVVLSDNWRGAAAPAADHIPQLNNLMRGLRNSQDRQQLDEAPHLYSFSNPLSDFASLSHAAYCRQPRFPHSEHENNTIVEYDMLDQAEDLVYISPLDELAQLSRPSDGPLILLVTINKDTNQITIWQAWYLKPQTLSSMLSRRAANKVAKARRRSSFMSVGRPNGASTPGVRHQDRSRESFAAAARIPVEPNSRRNPGGAPSLQDAEEVMASQMDPDYVPAKQSSKSTGRISSLLSRADASGADPLIKQTALGASFGAGSRRGPSLGSFNDRRSFGSYAHRKSRGSTPGSIFSRSMGPDDEGTNMSGKYEDMDDEFELTERLISASHHSAGADSVFGSATDGLRKDMVLRKLETYQSGGSSQPAYSVDSPPHASIRAASLARTSSSRHGDRYLDLYVLDKRFGSLSTISLHIQRRTVADMAARQESSSGPVPIPFVEAHIRSTGVHDLAKVHDGNFNAIILSTPNEGLRVIPSDALPWTMDLPHRAKLSDPSNVQHMLRNSKQDFGPARTVCFAAGPSSIKQTGSGGQIALQTADGYSHRIRIQLAPKNSVVRHVLHICKLVLSEKCKGLIQTLWCKIYHRFKSGTLEMIDGLDLEWEALLITLFTFAVGSVGRQLRVLNKSPDKNRRRDPSQNPISTAFDSQGHRRALETEFRRVKPPVWGWLGDASSRDRIKAPTRKTRPTTLRSVAMPEKVPFSMTQYEAMARHELHNIAIGELAWLTDPDSAGLRALSSMQIMLALHLFREEQKLDVISYDPRGLVSKYFSATIAQFGKWLGLKEWTFEPNAYYELDGASDSWSLSDSFMNGVEDTLPAQFVKPPSVYEWTERTFIFGLTDTFPTLEQIADIGTAVVETTTFHDIERKLLPRLCSLQSFAVCFRRVRPIPSKTIEALADCGLTSRVLETLPEAVLAPLREAISRCQSSPPTTWPTNLLQLVERNDLASLSEQGPLLGTTVKQSVIQTANPLPHDVHTIHSAADRVSLAAKTHEAERHAIISLIFSEDRRFVDAARLMNPTAVQLAECPPQPEWSEVEHLDQQKKVMQWVMIRTVALSPGDAMIHFESQRPLLSERFQIRGFSTSCQMKPMDNTISADRSGFTEEKFGWAFFHAGVSAGLSISRHATGIDTSWIVFNKPAELNNRHSGFLLALGINGHLRTLAKWLAFKYLTPKHNMTSIGLLLGLSASYLGSMDTLITPELNVSPTTQTAGLMGIGLLYYNTQHRRMSEVMMSEIEHRDVEEPGSTMELLRDESYRLAAGFALGYINLAKGRDLQGLRGMNLLERLLTVAIGPRPVDLVHVVDKATAGAVVAVALIYMKTEDRAVARKIDIPDTLTQLDHVRPDILLLRTLAKHLIMWTEITDRPGWVYSNLPQEYAVRYYGQDVPTSPQTLQLPQLNSGEVPFYNIITGLAWSLSLKFAGSGNVRARDEVLAILKAFIAVAKQEAYYYDAKLARNTVKRCMDVLALAAATIMADADTSYGSHLAAHLAIGVLFLGGGTYTLGTSDFAIAALVCAFYPLFPSDVLDNRVHLQALRHLWVFAAEPRCIVVQDIDTGRPIHMNLRMVMRDGSERAMKAPCLLPGLHTISRISTDDRAFWQITLDFAANPQHLHTFQRCQTIHVRRSPASEASSSVFSSALMAINGSQSRSAGRQMWEWIWSLSAFRQFDQADLELVLPPDAYSAVHVDDKATVVDTRLALGQNSKVCTRDDLWNLRLLFAWAQEAMNHGDGRLKWIGRDAIDLLRLRVVERTRTVAAAAQGATVF
ncbi:hypothetical protein MBLNU459_g0011t3 [Dothideomycetes sp. NU459]